MKFKDIVKVSDIYCNHIINILHSIYFNICIKKNKKILKLQIRSTMKTLNRKKFSQNTEILPSRYQYQNLNFLTEFLRVQCQQYSFVKVHRLQESFGYIQFWERHVSLQCRGLMSLVTDLLSLCPCPLFLRDICEGNLKIKKL